MKFRFLFTVSFLCVSLSFSQNTKNVDARGNNSDEEKLNLHESLCFYTTQQISRKGVINYLKTESLMVDEFTTPIRGRLVDFSLIRIRDEFLLEVSIQEDAEEPIYPVCIGNDASLKLHLNNGQQVVLPQFGEKRCGSRNVESNTYYNVTNQGFFLISPENLNKLRKSEVNLAEFSAKSYTFNFVFRSELYDEVNDIMIYPEYYFMSELECVINPILD